MTGPTALNRYAAEAFGTFALVFVGTGAVVVNDVTNGGVTHVGQLLDTNVDGLHTLQNRSAGGVWTSAATCEMATCSAQSSPVL